MALTEIQSEILFIISASRIDGGESYVAGGTALNFLLERPRLSRDIDLFHDTREALARTWQSDRTLLERAAFHVGTIRELPGLVEAVVSKGKASTLVQWALDSAFRFFPLIRDEVLGLALHPFDLATNKVLALVGRLEARDWIDVLGCHERLQELGYLTWAACGKDPGLNPELILNEANRSGRYTHEEIASLGFKGPPPDAGSLAQEWKRMLAQAGKIIALLPYEKVGTCVLSASGGLFRGDPSQLENQLRTDAVIFHPGSIRGAFPSFPGGMPDRKAGVSQ
jgi:hypothetical protein